MKIHQLEIDEALATLHGRAEGLGESEARRRLHEYGPNRIEEIRGESLLLAFAKEFTHFFALILWLAAGLAFLAESRDPGQGMAMLGYAMLGVILINGLFSFWQQYRAQRALAALRQLLPAYVKVQRDDRVRLIPAVELVPGDVMLLQEGDNVPADCRLLEAFGLRVNTATVTGESLPKARDAQRSSEEDLLHSRNVLLAGTAVVSGDGKALVFATGMHTEFGKIAHLTQAVGEAVSPLQREIIRLSRLVAVLAVSLGVVFFLIGQSMGLSFWGNFIFAIGIIVANVPEGLLPTVTLSLAMATQRMAKRNALIRHLPSVEALGSATVICTDKTGTLTQNRMEVVAVYLGGSHYSLPELRRAREMVSAYRRFFENAMLCHNLKETAATGRQRWLGDPMEIALLRMGKSCLGETLSYPKINEVPFDSDRKRLSTIHGTPKGSVLYCKGALETVLPLCRHAQWAGNVVPLRPDIRSRLLAAQETLAEQGLRVLALAWRELDDHEAPERDLVLLGLAGMEDPPRPEVPDAIAQCRQAGIRVIMVTGDHPHTAIAIARQIGLVQSDRPVVITGDRLRKLSDTQLQLALDAREILFARAAADQKLRIVKALKNKQEVVAVTGDGVNDAPALKMADIGIAMGVTGTDVAKESADIILLDDNFASIVAAVEEGRSVYDNIRRFLSYILTSNIPELVPYLAFALMGIPLPLTVIQILAVDLGTDMLPALGLGAEKPDEGCMQRPPRRRNERLLHGRLLAHAYLFLGPIEAVAGMAAYFFVLLRGGWLWNEALSPAEPLYRQATTACLGAIIITQIANVFLCKNLHRSVFGAPLLDNRIILWGIALEVAMLLAIAYTATGQAVFGTAPLDVPAWLFMLPFALGMVLLEEMRKWLAPRFRMRRTRPRPA